MLLCVIYLRVSTEEQARKGYSLPEQREACTEKAMQLAADHQRLTRRTATLKLAEFVDDYGGDVAERPALEQVREYVRIHRPAWFICMDPDRFSRSLKLQLIVADDIEAQGTRLAFVQQEYNPDDLMSRAFFQFRGLMSELDKAKILERTSRGKRGKLKAGRRPNGAAPFGYRHLKESDELVIYQPEAEWVRRIFTWVALDHQSVHAVTNRLNALGIPRKRNGRRWYRSVVTGLLRNTTYCGEMRCNRKDFRGIGSVRRLPRAKRGPLSARLRPPSEWITVPVPAIVSRDLWESAQVNLHAAGRQPSCAVPGMLSTLLRCGTCQGAMCYAGRYIRCQRKYTRPSEAPGCANPHHRVDRVEEAVWGHITERLTDRALLEQYLETGWNFPDARERLAEEERALRARLDAEYRVQRLTLRKQAQGEVSEEAADHVLAESRRSATQIIQELEVLQRLSKAAHPCTAPADVDQEAAAVRQALNSLRSAGRRHLVRMVVRHVTVRPDGQVEVVLRE